ncbi:MAG: DUF4347 domain-containing protein, partial [Spirulina sp. SIO3F2]|nr:DUF4347 domain-containing protein [Spirulina sp. SIO3F2]
MPRSLLPKSHLYPLVWTTSLLLISPMFLASSGWAQSITAAPDGTGTTITINGNIYHIEGGTQAGTNLFHSFQNFGLNTGEIADFFSQPNIINIFGRITGGNASIIDGLIQANPNLYLMNPAGIVFGANAQLNVGGDFFATTAEQICFEESCFNSVGLNNYHVLAGSPTTLSFLQSQPGGLINAGTLEVLKGKSIHLSGGTVVNLGQIGAPGGNATMAAIPGERRVRLSQPGNLLSVEITDEVLTTGIDPLALPELLATTPEHLQAKVVSAPLGNIAIGGEITAEHIDLYATGQVTPNEPNLVQGDIRVIRFSETGENPFQAVFIDRRTDNPEALLYGAEAGTVAQIIEKDEQGIAEISEQLAVISEAVGELESVAIVAEGNAGNFWLGNQWIRAGNITDYQAQLQTWESALTSNADILLYSCLTALGTTGETLIASLANLTGADVAASINATGSANYDADWNLEHSTGDIEASNPFTGTTLADWEGKLLTRTITNNADSGTRTLRDALTDNSGGFALPVTDGDTIVFNLAGSANTITLSSEILWTTDNLTLDGANAGGAEVVVDGNNATRLFNISAANATIENITLQRGNAGNGGAIRGGSGALTLNNVQVLNNSASAIGGVGGGIYSDGDVTLNNSVLTGNSSGFWGGGLFNSRIMANIVLNNSTIAHNSAVLGGGIVAQANNLTLDNTDVVDNTVSSNGGGIFANSTTLIVNNGSTIARNSAGPLGGGILSAGAGRMTVNDSSISNNSAVQDGGGIHGSGLWAFNNATVSGNFAGNNGGGISSSIAIVTLNHSSLSGNSAGNHGGGIYNRINLTLTASTISGNSSAVNGGGIFARGNATLYNATLSGNAANQHGGGIYANGTVNLHNATVAFNTANADNAGGGNGGGIAIQGTHNHTFANSIIANNGALSGPNADIFADFSSSTLYNNLIQATTGITGATLTPNFNGHIIGQDPQLAPLANNGGSTPTHRLLPGSPALNAGNNTQIPAALTTDQAGQSRILEGTVDIGAYEGVATVLEPAAPSPETTAIATIPLDFTPLDPLNALDKLSRETISRDRVSDLLANNQICEAIITLDQLHTQTIEQHLGRFESRKPMTCAEMQQRLPDDAVLLYIFAQTDKLHLITLR